MYTPSHSAYIPHPCTLYLRMFWYMPCMCRRNSFRNCLCLPQCSQTPQLPTAEGSPCEYADSDTVHSEPVNSICKQYPTLGCVLTLHRLKMVAKLGSLTQRVQSLSSASTLVYSQLSLLQLSRAAASGQYIRTYAHLRTHARYTSLSVLLAAHMHTCIRT